MAEKSSKPIIDFGDASNVAPSIKKVDLLGWVIASLVFGFAAAWLSLWATWRPLPGLTGPIGPLGDHAMALIRCSIHWIFPPVFPQASRIYFDHLSGLPEDAKHALIWRVCLGAWAFCIPSILLAKWCLTPRDALTAIRGAARFEGRQAVDRLNKALAAKVARVPDHEIAPAVRYPSDMWTRHVLIVAGSGSGKSTALKPLIRSVIGAGESLLLFDPKGEFTKGFRAPDILAPWDDRSLAWDIAKDMRNIGAMRHFAESMIRGGHDPMWSNAARQILVGFIVYLKSTRGDDWGWRQLADLFAIPQSSILPMMEAHHPEAIRSVERHGVTMQGILINLSAFASSVFDLAEAWGETPKSRRVSFVDWAHQKGPRKQIILQGHGAYPELTKSCLEGIIGTVSAVVNSVEMDDDETRKLWIIADEAPQMGKVPIQPLLEVGRSRGVRCVLACQDLAQLEEIHGANMVRATVSMVGTIIVGQLLQGDTAEQMCKAMGAREVERANISSSGGSGANGPTATLSFSREEIPLYRPSELSSRLGPTADGRGIVFALVTGGNAYELFWPRRPMAVARKAHIPASWTMRFRQAVPGDPSPQIVAPAASGIAPASKIAPVASMRSAVVGTIDDEIASFDSDDPALPLQIDAAIFDDIFDNLGELGIDPTADAPNEEAEAKISEPIDPTVQAVRKPKPRR